MVILDANLWIAYLNLSDSQHEKAVGVFDLLKEKVLLPEYIWIEVVSVLHNKVSKEMAEAFIEMVQNSVDVQILYIDPEIFGELMHFYNKSSHKKLSFVDHSLLYFSHHYQVFSFDIALAKLLA